MNEHDTEPEASALCLHGEAAILCSKPCGRCEHRCGEHDERGCTNAGGFTRMRGLDRCDCQGFSDEQPA